MLNLPKIGLGTYKHKGKKGTDNILFALKTGYRLIDTADHYNNHKTIAKVLQKTKVKRKDITLVTKCWRNDLLFNTIYYDTNKFLKQLQTNYIDILLIHWPNPIYNQVNTIKAMQKLKKEGIVKYIGLSNYTTKMLKQIYNKGLTIDVIQNEIHPLLPNKSLVNFCTKKGIKIMSHSSLAGGRLLKISEVTKIANKHNASEAQVIYSYLIKNNITPVVGFANKNHITQNYKSININLSQSDCNIINILHKKYGKYRSLKKSYSFFTN